MKKFTSFLSVILLVMSVTLVSSCESQAVKNLKKQVEIANAECPLDGGITGDLISVKYDEKHNCVEYYWTINEDLVTIDFLRTSEEDVHNIMKLMVQDNSSREMLKDLIKAGASLNYVYKSPSTGETAQFLLSLQDLKDIQNAPLMAEDERLRMILSNQVKLENKKCPYMVANGMRMTEVDIANDNMIYYCELDEDLYDVNQLKSVDTEMRQMLEEYFKEMLRSDIVMQHQFRMMTQVGIGIHYRYYGNKSQNTCDIIFTPQELQSLFPKKNFNYANGVLSSEIEE